MHGQLPRILDEKLVDIEQSYRWLKYGDIKGETESTIVAAQDQAISTNYFKNKILKKEIESKCRLCKQHEETIDHLTSGCPILAKNEYLMRHDKVCTHLHYSICKALGIEENFDIQHKNEKEKLKKEYLRRLRLVLGTELSAKNKIQAIGSLAVPVLRYSFELLTGTKKNCKN